MTKLHFGPSFAAKRKDEAEHPEFMTLEITSSEFDPVGLYYRYRTATPSPTGERSAWTSKGDLVLFPAD